MILLLQLNSLNREYAPYVTCTLNGITVHALIDSGNTSFNAINENLAQKLFGNNFRNKLQPVVNKSIGTAKKGISLDVLGKVRQPLKLKLGHVAVTLKTYPIVIKGLNSAFNISGPFLARYGLDLLLSKQAIRVKGRLVPLRSYKEVKGEVHQLGDELPNLHTSQKDFVDTTYEQNPEDFVGIGQCRCYVNAEVQI